jgi:endonuclease YncB( thermonuclease family)
MKILLTLPLCCLLALVCAPPVMAQSAEPVVDPCGDPRVESFSCPHLRGKVVEVVDGDTIVLALADRRRVRVELVGISAPERRQAFGRAARLLLQSLVAGRVVEVCASTSQYLLLRRSKIREMAGVVQLREMGMLDVNLSMIQAGLARHAKARPYYMSNHDECHYGRAEKEARAAGRGLWPAPHNNGMHPNADTPPLM